MNKNSVFGVGILLIILAIIAGLLLNFFILDKEKEENTTNNTYNLDHEGFRFEAKYQGESTWGYLIKGNKPTPCHEIRHEAIVLESFPEQVTVNLSLISPSPETACIQMIEEITVTGSFSASSEAKINFIVSNE